MTLPEPLRDFVTGARSFIERAHNLDVTVAARNAETMLRSAKAYVASSADLETAFDDAIGRIADFHEEVVDQNTLTIRVTPAIENARQIALLAIDRLAGRLEDAKPSDEARALGLDWF